MTTSNTFTVKDPTLTSVRLATTANVTATYSNGPSNDGIDATLTVAASSLTVDGVVSAVGDDILFNAQTSGFENGIYRVTSIGSTVVLTRRPDFQNVLQMAPGFNVNVAAGTEHGGSMWTVVEPAVSVIGTDTVSFINSGSTTGDVTFTNTGLKIFNPAGTFTTTMKPGTAITADRVFTFSTGDANRALDISAADVTISAFAATVLDDANAPTAQQTLGITATLTDIWAGGGASNAFTAVGVQVGDIVTASVLTSTNAVSIVRMTPGAATLTVVFSADPGANTQLMVHAITA